MWPPYCVFSWNATSGESKIYVNGSVVASAENSGDAWRQPIEARSSWCCEGR